MLGEVALNQGENERTVSFSQESLAIWGELGNKRMTGLALRNLGLAAYKQGNLLTARSQLLEALSLL